MSLRKERYIANMTDLPMESPMSELKVDKKKEWELPRMKGRIDVLGIDVSFLAGIS